MKRLRKHELREILNKCWMTHDAMWFLHCMQQCGIDKANLVNKAAVRSMAMIEIERVRKAFALEAVNTLEDLKVLLMGLREVFECDFNRVDFSFPSKNTIRFALRSCFAYEGVTRMGILDRYECGIFSRFEGWFEGLGIRYEVAPPMKGCLMHTAGECYRDYTLVI